MSVFLCMSIPRGGISCFLKLWCLQELYSLPGTFNSVQGLGFKWASSFTNIYYNIQDTGFPTTDLSSAQFCG